MTNFKCRPGYHWFVFRYPDASMRRVTKVESDRIVQEHVVGVTNDLLKANRSFLPILGCFNHDETHDIVTIQIEGKVNLIT